MHTVNLIDCEEEINKAGISVPIEQHIQSYTMVYNEIWKEKNNHTLQVKIMLTIQMIIQMLTHRFYKVFYYYFFPTLVIVIVFFFG